MKYLHILGAILLSVSHANGFAFLRPSTRASSIKSANEIKFGSKMVESKPLNMRLFQLYSGFILVIGSSSYFLNGLIGPSYTMTYLLAIISKTFLTIHHFFKYGGSKIAKDMGGINALDEDKALYDLVQHVARESNIPPIESVWILPADEMNAFAAGISSDKAAIAVTRGLRAKLSESELKAVIAHECGHIKNKDMLKNMHLAAVVSGFYAIYNLGTSLLRITRNRTRSRHDKSTEKKDKSSSADSITTIAYVMVFGGAMMSSIGFLFQRFLSRGDEYNADAHAASIINPSKMISALQRIEDVNKIPSSTNQQQQQQQIPIQTKVFKGKYSAMYIHNEPFVKLPLWLLATRNKLLISLKKVLSLLSTHPDTSDRIERLKKLV